MTSEFVALIIRVKSAGLLMPHVNMGVLNGMKFGMHKVISLFTAGGWGGGRACAW